MPCWILICFGEKCEIPVKPSDFYHLSFLPGWDSQGYRMLESLLGSIVMVKFKLCPLPFSLFCYLLRAFIGGRGLAQLLFHYFIFFETLRRVHKETYPNYPRWRERERLYDENMFWVQVSRQAHTYNSLSKHGFRIGGQGYNESTRRDDSKIRSFCRGLMPVGQWGSACFKIIHICKHTWKTVFSTKRRHYRRWVIWQYY